MGAGWAGIAGVFCVGAALAAAVTAALGLPPPAIHDEFSYLLAADTFVHGRLANPEHPLARFFESFHVLQHPSYASKFPPGQGLFLAAGQATTGHPIVGVWLSFGIMCAAILWMLRAWVGPRWAVLVSLSFACYLAPTYWAWSYWGGAVAATGGALVAGALGRFADREITPWRVGLPLGAGALILANTRPYEGALLVAFATAWIAGSSWRSAGFRRGEVVRALAPAGLILLVGAVAMAAENHAVTGRYLQMPYMAYQRLYDGVPVYTWQPLGRPPPVANQTISDFQAWELLCTSPAFSPRHWLQASLAAGLRALWFFVPLPLALPLLVGPALRRDRRLRLALAWVTVVIAGIGLARWFQLHYLAPVAPLVVVLFAGALKELSRVHVRGWRVGVVAALAVAACGFYGGAVRLHSGGVDWIGRRGFRVQPWARARERLIRRLEDGGPSLIIVRYGRRHSPHKEWVHNGADIDGAPVIWARDLGPRQDAVLLERYPERRVWRLDVDEDTGPFKLAPYSAAAGGEPLAAAPGESWISMAQLHPDCPLKPPGDP